MFLTILCYYSCVDKSTPEYILKEFKECNNTCVSTNYYNITEYDINQTICIRGSFIIGANESFTAIAGFSTNLTSEPFKTVKSQDDILSVLEHIEIIPDSEKFREKNFQALTKINCKKYPCKIQILDVEPSQFVNIKFKSYNMTIHYNVGRKSFVSTKRSGSVTMNFEIKTSNDGKNYEQYFRTPAFKIAGFNHKKFAYKVGKNITLHGRADEQLLPSTWNESGDLGTASFLSVSAEANYVEATKGDIVLSWEESKETSSEDEKKMLIPEFEATLSAEGGVFTEKNIDQSFPGGGLSAGAIAGIVIACIAAIAIIAVCIWLFTLGGIKKCRKDKSDSSSKKEQDK